MWYNSLKNKASHFLNFSCKTNIVRQKNVTQWTCQYHYRSLQKRVIQKTNNRVFTGVLLFNFWWWCPWVLRLVHAAWSFCEGQRFFLSHGIGCVEVYDTVHMVLAISCACDAYLCATSHMNRYHTHSVRLRHAIPMLVHYKLHPDSSHCVNKITINLTQHSISWYTITVARRIVWTSLQITMFCFLCNP